MRVRDCPVPTLGVYGAFERQRHDQGVRIFGPQMGADFSGGVWPGGHDGVDRFADDDGERRVAGLCIFA